MKREAAMAKQLEMTKQDVAALYDSDFFEWTQRCAELIRQGRLNQADLGHVAAEIEDLGNGDRREVRSRLIVLIAHLLKWQLQPERRSPSWRETIFEQRLQVGLVLDDSPSLHGALGQDLRLVYTRAVRKARSETELPGSRFSAQCPYSESEILDFGFLPE
jgi:hypothetical protein